MDTTVASFDSAQRAVWASFLGGKNVAILGPAGCGKSRVLHPCIAEARRRYGDEAVLIMAWTWAAAYQIGGRSYHSYLGISPTEYSKQRTLEMVRANARIRVNLERSRVVIIDEAPTMTSHHFALLEYVLRSLSPAHMQGTPWGGRQVICTCGCQRSLILSIRYFFVVLLVKLVSISIVHDTNAVVCAVFGFLLGPRLPCFWLGCPEEQWPEIHASSVPYATLRATRSRSCMRR